MSAYAGTLWHDYYALALQGRRRMEFFMNKTLLIGLLSVGFAAFVHADEQNPVPTYVEYNKMAQGFVDLLAECQLKDFTGRQCALRVFKFGDKNDNRIYDHKSCTMGKEAFDSIYKHSCSNLPTNQEDCDIIRKVRDRFNWTCEYLDQLKKQKTSV
jgi:hypothetical protein